MSQFFAIHFAIRIRVRRNDLESLFSFVGPLLLGQLFQATDGIQREWRAHHGLFQGVRVVCHALRHVLETIHALFASVLGILWKKVCVPLDLVLRRRAGTTALTIAYFARHDRKGAFNAHTGCEPEPKSELTFCRIPLFREHHVNNCTGPWGSFLASKGNRSHGNYDCIRTLNATVPS